MSQTIAYLALGGNVGDVETTFRDTLRHLSGAISCFCLKTSRLYRTSPWGDPDQPDYLNLVIELHWTSDLELLAKVATGLENQAGRDRATERRWGPRPLDIDLLLFGGELREDPELTLPHPRMKERRFVLAPLADLAPELVLPGESRTVRELLDVCEDTGHIEPLSEGCWVEWCEE